jgi:hypothetical protein
MVKPEPHYVSPIFGHNELIRRCTINVYQDKEFPNVYIKSRFSYDAMALLEPGNRWGNFIYRIRIKPHGNQG